MIAAMPIMLMYLGKLAESSSHGFSCSHDEMDSSRARYYNVWGYISMSNRRMSSGNSEVWE